MEFPLVTIAISAVLLGFFACLDPIRKEKKVLEQKILVPFVLAAADVAATMENLVRFDLMHYLRDGIPVQQHYVLNYTAYRLCKYLAYHYLVLQNIHSYNAYNTKSLKENTVENTTTSMNKLKDLLDDVKNAFTTDVLKSPIFHLFTGEQCLISDYMRTGEEVISYKDFLWKLEGSEKADKAFQDMITRVKDWLYAYSYWNARPLNFDREIHEAEKRMKTIMESLKVLTDYLDPKQRFHARLPKWKPKAVEDSKEVGTLDKVMIPKEEIKRGEDIVL